MTRPLRRELAGGFYHVTSRGDRREDIFLCETDRHVGLEILGEVCKRFHWICHAWCQMTVNPSLSWCVVLLGGLALAASCKRPK